MYKTYEDIKTVSDARTYLGLPIVTPTVSGMPENRAIQALTNYDIDTVIEACNKLANGGEKWIPDYNNYNQRKYYPWWDMETYDDAPPGSGFALFGVHYDDSFSCVGARRDCISEKVCRYICTQFIDLFRVTHKL